MTSPLVPSRRNLVAYTEIQNGREVKASTFTDMGQICNWLLGRGMQDVPCYAPFAGSNGALASGTEYGFHFRLRPRYQSLRRVWQINARADATATAVDFEAPAGSAVTTASAVSARSLLAPLEVIESVTQSASESELTLTVKPTSQNMVIDAIGAWSIPRGTLNAANDDRGVDITAFRAGQAISAESLYAAAKAQANLRTVLADVTLIGRRVLVQWAVPADANGTATTAFAATTTSTTFQDLWESEGVPVLARKVTRTGTTATIKAKFYAWVEATGGGEIRITTSHSATTTSAVTISATTPTWSDALTFVIDCEDMDAADGLQAATFDELQVEYRSTVVGKAIYLASASAWED